MDKSGHRLEGFPGNLRTVSFLAHLCKVTFNIPEAYLDPNQLFRMELFAKIIKGFQAITIFAKSSILDV